METKPEAGRRLVLAIIVASLALSVLAILVFNVARGPERLPQQIVRFLLTVGLCVFLYRGANWARWVAGILFTLGGVGSLLVGSVALTTSLAGLLLIAMGLIYAGSAVVLFFVPPVQRYFGVGNPMAG